MEGKLKEDVEIDAGQARFVRLELKPKQEGNNSDGIVDIPPRESFLVEADGQNCDTYGLVVVNGIVSARQLEDLSYPIFSGSEFSQTLKSGLRLVRIIPATNL